MKYQYRAMYVRTEAWHVETSATADIVIENDKAPERTGLVDKNGIAIYRVPEKNHIGY